MVRQNKNQARRRASNAKPQTRTNTEADENNARILAGLSTAIEGIQGIQTRMDEFESRLQVIEEDVTETVQQQPQTRTASRSGGMVIEGSEEEEEPQQQQHRGNGATGYPRGRPAKTYESLSDLVESLKGFESKYEAVPENLRVGLATLGQTLEKMLEEADGFREEIEPIYSDIFDTWVLDE